MLVIGLTGGIGSGKSTVANLFSTLSVPIIDADDIARQLADTETHLDKLSHYFGPTILKKDGTLDRYKLKKLIFTDASKKKWLEQFLHPLIIEEIKATLRKIRTSYCIVVIPLLIETGPYPFIDRILVIDAPEEKCLERAKNRDQLNSEDLLKIINSQAKREERLAVADEVINNFTDDASLQQQVENLHHHYLKLAQNLNSL